MDTQETKVVDEIKSSKEMGWINTLFSKIKGKVLIYVILGIAALIGVYYFASTRNPSVIKQTDKDNKQLELRADSFAKANIILKAQMDSIVKYHDQQFIDLIKKNNDLMQQNNNSLNQLKKMYNEKINSIGNYNTTQLDSFFTNRYKEYYK